MADRTLKMDPRGARQRQLTIRIPGPMPGDPWTELIVAEEYVLSALAYQLHASHMKELVLEHPRVLPFDGAGVGRLRVRLDVIPGEPEPAP